MNIVVSTASATSVPGQWLVVGVWEKAPLPSSAAAIDQAAGGVISDLQSRGDITGKLAETVEILKAPESLRSGFASSDWATRRLSHGPNSTRPS